MYDKRTVHEPKTRGLSEDIAMKNECTMKNAALMNDEALENVNGGFPGLLTPAFFGSCAIGTGLGFWAMEYADDDMED